MKIAMKNESPLSRRYELTALGLLLGCGWLLLASANAQTLRNPGFESPLDPWDPLGLSGGKTNWTLVYARGGPGDFAMKDRSRASAHSGSLGAHFRPATEWTNSAYFTQTVSNLTANASYVVSGWIKLTFVQAKFHVYIETLGGPAGTTSAVSAPPTTEGSWIQYSVTNTASTAGTLEVRLHADKETTPLKDAGLALFNVLEAYFDDFSLAPQ
jgi:hypothetical protein